MSNVELVEQRRETVARLQAKAEKLAAHLESTYEAIATAERELAEAESAVAEVPADGERVDAPAGHASGTGGAKT